MGRKKKDDGEKKEKGGRHPQLVPAVVIAVAALAGGKMASGGGAAAPVAAADAHGSGEIHWTYEGHEGPEHWSELSPEFSVCAEGTKQSPIDISKPTKADLTDVTFSYPRLNGTVVDNGHAVQVKFPKGAAITLEGVKYDLKQMHFHTPSEHTIEGKAVEGELHLVHATPEGQLAVVGLLIEPGADNAAFVPMLEALPHGDENNLPSAGGIDLARLLPHDRSTIRYEGSLTTPPCSESVRWLVVQEPIAMSVAQLAQIRAVQDENARPVQATNARPVVVDAGTDR